MKAVLLTAALLLTACGGSRHSSSATSSDSAIYFRSDMRLTDSLSRYISAAGQLHIDSLALIVETDSCPRRKIIRATVHGISRHDSTAVRENSVTRSMASDSTAIRSVRTREKETYRPSPALNLPMLALVLLLTVCFLRRK